MKIPDTCSRTGNDRYYLASDQPEGGLRELRGHGGIDRWLEPVGPALAAATLRRRRPSPGCRKPTGTGPPHAPSTRAFPPGVERGLSVARASSGCARVGTMGDQMTTHQSAAAVAGTAPTAARLEPDAIGVAQDTVIGMATAAPTASVGLTLAAIAGAAAYASGPVIILTAIPMLIIANAYRRLNMWNANCGAAFEWVGRSISPSLGLITGWLMIMGSIIGCVSTAVVLGPSVLAIFGSTSSAILPNITIDTVVILVMLVISIVGIRITARTQVGIGLVEYAILLGIAVVGLFLVISHHHGTYPISKGWFTISGVGGHGSLA